MTQAAILAEGLTYRYGDNLAVDHISFEVAPGEVIGFLGPNGAGKSTTVKLLTGQLTPAEGRAQLLGMDIVRERKAVQKRIGVAFENTNLYEQMNAVENLDLFARLYGVRDFNALELLENESRSDVFRVLWVGGVALIRAVGHVLQKVDGQTGEVMKRTVAAAYASWKGSRNEHSIFWDFIEDERNRMLKEYEAGFVPDPAVYAEGEWYVLDENLFCPMRNSTFAGEDCRDVFAEAVRWWDEQLGKIEAAVQEQVSRGTR